jgi:type I restriction enzyme R subunit
MKQNIENAVELYSGKDAFDFFVVKLPKQIEKLDNIFKEIKAVFEDAGILNFASLPTGYAEQNQFSHLFNTLTSTLKAAKSQGFDWDAEQLSYYDEETDSRIPIKSPDITEDDYQTLLLRYRELSTGSSSIPKPPLLVDFLVNPQSSELINKEYLNSRFTKFLLDINQKNLTEEERDALCNNFHTNFSKLPVSDQVYAEIILSQIKDGSLQVSPEDSFTDLINELKITKEEKRILVFAKTFGLDLGRLKERVNHYSPNENINKDSLFEQLAETADIEKTKAFFDKETGMTLQDFEVPFLLRERLEAFIKGEPEADVPSDETDN